MRKILFTGGGSAGHVIPNVALIEELRSRGDADVAYMGTDGVERELIVKRGVPYYTVRCPKLIRGGGVGALANNVRIPLALLRAVREAQRGLREIRPDVVFSKGGYVALPVVLAAHKLKIPCYAHESDLSVGLANKLSARKCKAVFTSFPETAKTIEHGVYSGAPVRKELFSASRKEARKRFGIPLTQTVVLVFGGGSGSRAINEAVRAQLPRLTRKYVVLHVCGKGNLVESRIKNYIQKEFVSDMGSAYACADVVLSRAGSGTLFELLALKKSALLVPLEGRTRGDQAENARYFQARGLCRVLPQSRLHDLAAEIEKTVLDDGLRARLAHSAFQSGNARIIEALLGYGV